MRIHGSFTNMTGGAEIINMIFKHQRLNMCAEEFRDFHIKTS